MKKNKLLAVILCVIMLLPMAAACGNGGDSGTQPSAAPQSPDVSQAPGTSPTPALPSEPVRPPVDPTIERDTLTIAVDSDAGTLNPATMPASGLYTALECIFEPLWEYTEKGGMKPILMESYEIISDEQWTIKIKDNVYFSNGNKMTADDVVFSLDYWKTVGSNAVRVQSIQSIEKVDDYTVNMFLPSFYLMHETAASMFFIFDSATFDESTAASQPIGTGPYAVKEYVTSSHLFLERRDDYWGEQPEIQFLNFRVISEPSQVVNALSTNTIDIGRVQLSDYAHVSTLPGYNINSRDTGGGIQLLFGASHRSYFTYLGGKDPEKVKEARYAVIHAIDPSVIIDVIYEGIGREMRSYSPDFCLDFEDDFNDMHPTYSEGYNLELARQYAESSGLSGQTIRMITNGTPLIRSLAEIIQDMLRQIDVTVEINNTDVGTYQTARYDAEGDFDLGIMEGIAPNWRVADGIVNSIRYSAAQSVPGAFPNNEEYLQTAPLTVYTADPALRREYLVWSLYTFMDNALQYAICLGQTAFAVSSDIDMSTVDFNLTSAQMDFLKMKWAF